MQPATFPASSQVLKNILWAVSPVSGSLWQPADPPPVQKIKALLAKVGSSSEYPRSGRHCAQSASPKNRLESQQPDQSPPRCSKTCAQQILQSLPASGRLESTHRGLQIWALLAQGGDGTKYPRSGRHCAQRESSNISLASQQPCQPPPRCLKTLTGQFLQTLAVSGRLQTLH